jgi:MerR family transcriptional regulator, copper efflux regulator
MLIGEIADKTGFSRDTIRYYEKMGLIKVGKKSRRDNNYKEYPDSVLERLQIIRRAKHLGFSLREIGDLIESWAGKTLTKEERIGLFKSRIKLIEEKIEKLREVKYFIKVRIKEIEKLKD